MDLLEQMASDPARPYPAFQQLRESNNPEVITLFAAYAGFGNSTVPLEFIEAVKASNDTGLFSFIFEHNVKITDRKAMKLTYRWFVETKNRQILKLLYTKSGEYQIWLKSRATEIVRYAIEWEDNPLLRYCSETFPLEVDTLKLMIEQAPVQLEVLMVSWTKKFYGNPPVDFVDCLIAHYRGANKVRLLAIICLRMHFKNVDIVRRVANNHPEALACFQDWSVYPSCPEVCDLFMFNSFGYKLHPIALVDKNPQYLAEYQKEIRLSEFVNQLDKSSTMDSLGYATWDTTMVQRLKLCKIAGYQINIGDLVNQILYLTSPTLRRLNPDPNLDAAAFTEYMDVQTLEYRQEFRETLAAYSSLYEKGDSIPPWAYI
jgi:hypothetical protein